MPDELDILHEAIDNCRICERFVPNFKKPAPGMDRGSGNDIFIVGQAPGKTEITSSRAFSGASGTRLDKWLVASGRPSNDPRQGVYLTSILKCPHNSPRDFQRMERNCRHFLDEQIELIKPRLVITLGKESFEYLRLTDGDYDSMIGSIHYIAQSQLTREQPFSAVIHWPHPSGLNRWHNQKGNPERMQRSFQEIKQLLEVQG
jgi:uracil-DNA glycosylase family 4